MDYFVRKLNEGTDNCLAQLTDYLTINFTFSRAVFAYIFPSVISSVFLIEEGDKKFVTKFNLTWSFNFALK